MRKLLATLVLLPGLGSAQVPIRPPTGAPPRAAPAPATPRPGVVPAAPRPRIPGNAASPEAPDPAEPEAAAPRPASTGSRSTDSKCVPLRGRFMLSFNKADVVDILEQASRWTCRNFVYTDDVARGKITLLSKTPVTAEEAYAAFLAALNSNNIAVYPTGKYFKLIRIADSKKNPIPTYTDGRSGTPANEQPITKVIRLQYADADQMRGVIGNFLSSQGADVQSVPPDMLIVTDIGLNLRRIERIMEAIDRAGAGDLVRIVQIRFASAKDIADKVNQIFQAQGGKAGARRTMTAPGAVRTPSRVPQPAAPAAPGRVEEVSVTKILPDERTNKLIVIADEKSFQRIVELIEQLDVPTSGEGGIHVVFLKNANAEDLAQTLSNLAQGQAKRQPGAPVPVQTPAAAARGGAHGDVTAELFSGEVKITSDKTQNALLVQASGSDFGAIQRLIDKLDRPRRQVFVEAVILEVNLRNDRQLGVGVHAAFPFDRKGETGVIPLSSQPGRVSSFDLLGATSLGGFLSGFVGPVSTELKALGLNLPSLGVLIQALQTSSDVNVLSTPHLVAMDNEESEIVVGQNVPFQAGYAPSGLQGLLSGSSGTSSAVGSALALGGLQNLYAPIQRQPVELRLKIKPQINEGGNVRLTIEEQTEEIADRDAQLGPTTSKRSVKTQVVARDQSTIVIGGLIQERNVRSVKKVPFLGSLPVIGWLFRDTLTTKSKTNLLLFLTPYIIRDESDYRRIYEKKRKEQQEFIEQFYGRQPAFEIEIDFTRKAGPYAKMRAGVAEEASKLENGGPGGPGERVTTPGDVRPSRTRFYSAPQDEELLPSDEPVEPPGEETETPVDSIEVQPEVSPTGEGPPPVAAPPQAPEQRPPAE